MSDFYGGAPVAPAPPVPPAAAPGAPVAAYGPPVGPVVPMKGAGLAIGAMSVSIFSLVFSWVPIFNNLMAFTALVGLVLGIIAYVGGRKLRRKGKGMALTAIICAVCALGIVLASQALYSHAIDNVSKSLATTASNKTPAIGTPITVTRLGATGVVSVDSVQVSTSTLGTPVTVVSVTAVGVAQGFDINPFDFYLLDANGTKIQDSFQPIQDTQLNAVTLHKGERATGSFAFETTALQGAKLIYAPGDSSPVATWTLR